MSIESLPFLDMYAGDKHKLLATASAVRWEQKMQYTDFKAYQSMRALWEQRVWLAVQAEKEFVTHLANLK